MLAGVPKASPVGLAGCAAKDKPVAGVDVAGAPKFKLGVGVPNDKPVLCGVGATEAIGVP